MKRFHYSRKSRAGQEGIGKTVFFLKYGSSFA
jgi:hypothetical protein